MTDAELADAFASLRVLCTNIIGFHISTEREGFELHPVDRIAAETNVYAGGLALAYRVHQIADELERRQ